MMAMKKELSPKETQLSN